VTILVGGIGVTLAVLLAGLLGEMGSASALRARAQSAADAAALAAVAESGPYGDADPERQAALYARRNGGTLVECRCATGATAVQVEVQVGGVHAEARAVIDAELFVPALFGAGSGHMHPQLSAAVARLVAASNGAVHVVSGVRSTAEQSRLWNDALQRYGSAEAADDWVAPPGHSMHEKGLAVDLSGDIDLALSIIEAHHLPLWRPLHNEPWHFELAGSRS
jgi:D-alanyl-D-alanine carboxypeptidase/Putative Flp pilus-assembly TadE/G-like